jgi:hypothetical protein
MIRECCCPGLPVLARPGCMSMLRKHIKYFSGRWSTYNKTPPHVYCRPSCAPCRLHWQLQWRYGCDPSSACCSALPSDSFLNASIGLGGLTPQTTSRCEELPGCTADTYCWPAWGADTCQSLSSASCKENRQCQVRAVAAWL